MAFNANTRFSDVWLTWSNGMVRRLRANATADTGGDKLDLSLGTTPTVTWAAVEDGDLKDLRDLYVSAEGLRDADGDKIDPRVEGCPFTTMASGLEPLGYVNPLDNASHARIVLRRQTANAAANVDGILTRNTRNLLTGHEVTLATGSSATTAIIEADDIPTAGDGEYDGVIRFAVAVDGATLGPYWITLQDLADLPANDSFDIGRAFFIYQSADTSFSLRLFKKTNGDLSVHKRGGSGPTTFSITADYFYYTETYDRVAHALQDIIDAGADEGYLSGVSILGPVYQRTETDTAPSTPTGGAVTATAITTVPTGWSVTELMATAEEHFVWASYCLHRSDSSFTWLHPILEAQSTALRQTVIPVASHTDQIISSGDTNAVGTVPAAGGYDERFLIEARVNVTGATATKTWITRAALDAGTKSDTAADATQHAILSDMGLTLSLYVNASGQFRVRCTANTNSHNYDITVKSYRIVEGMDRIAEALREIVGTAATSPIARRTEEDVLSYLGHSFVGSGTHSYPLGGGTPVPIPANDPAALYDILRVRVRQDTGAWTTTLVPLATVNSWARNNTYSAENAALIFTGRVASVQVFNVYLTARADGNFGAWASNTGGVFAQVDYEIERIRVIEQLDDLREAIEAVVRTQYTTAEEAKLAGVEAGATADQTATEIRDLLAGLAGTSRLDADAIKNLPGAILEGFEIRETVIRADAADSFGPGVFTALSTPKPTSRATDSYADVFRFEFTRNGVTTVKRVPRPDIAALAERGNQNDPNARITLLSDSGFEIFLWSREGSLPNSLRISTTSLTARTYNLEVVREEYHLTSDPVHTALNNATVTEPYLIGRVYRHSVTAANPGKPEDGSGSGSAAQGVVTKTAITTAPTGWSTDIFTPNTVWTWAHASDCLGYEVNGVLHWKWSPVYIYDRFIHPAPYSGAWNATTEFFTSQIVAHAGVLWMCVTGSVTGTEPGTDETVWTRIAHAALQWATGHRYSRGMTVYEEDNPTHLYVCLAGTSRGTSPTSDGQTDWLRLGFIPDGSIQQAKLHSLVTKLLLPAYNASSANKPLVSSGASAPTWKQLEEAGIKDGAVALAKLKSDVTDRLVPSTGTTGHPLVKGASGAAFGQVQTAGIGNDQVTRTKLSAALRAELDGKASDADITTAVNNATAGLANPVPPVSGLTVVYDRQTSVVAPESVPSGRMQLYNSTGSGGTGTRGILTTYRSALSANGGLGATLQNSRYMQLAVHQSDKRSSVGSKRSQYIQMLMELWGYPVSVLVYWADDRWILYSAAAAGNSQAVTANNVNVRLNSVEAFNLSGVGSLNDTMDSSDVIVRWGFSPDLDTTYALSHSDTRFRRVAVGTTPPAPTAQWGGSSYTGDLASTSDTVPSGTNPLWLFVARATRPAGGAWGSTTWSVYPATDGDNPFFDARYSTNPAGPFTSTTPISVGYAQITVEGGAKLVVPIGQTGQYTGSWTRLLTNDHVSVATEGNINLANNINLHDFNEVYFDFGMTSGSNGEGPVVIRADEIKVVDYHHHVDHKNALLTYHSDYGTGIVFGRNPNDALAAADDDQCSVRLVFRRPLGEDGVGTRFGAIDVDAVSFGTGTTPVLSMYAR